MRIALQFVDRLVEGLVDRIVMPDGGGGGGAVAGTVRREPRNLVREVFGPDERVGLGERGNPPQLVGQLPWVTRPSIEQQVLHRLLAEPGRRLPQVLGVLLEEALGRAPGSLRGARGAAES